MIKTIYLHTGFHKTGSSAIQQILANNRVPLKNIGFLYPEFRKKWKVVQNHSEVFYSLFCRHPESYRMNVIMGINTIKKVNEIHAGYRRQITDQLKNFTGENLVISGEDIIILTQKELLNLKKNLVEYTHPDVKIKIIAYCRNPISWARSQIQEVVKGGYSLEEAYQKHFTIPKPYFKFLIRKLSSAFDGSDVIILRYEDALKHPHGIVGSFLTKLGIPKMFISQIGNEYINQSLSYESTVLLSALYNKYPFIVNNRRNPSLKDFEPTLLMNIKGQKFTLSKSLYRKIWENVIEDVNWLNRELNLPKYEYFTEHTNDEKKWDSEVIKYIVDNIFPVIPLHIANVFLCKICDEMAHYKSIFPVEKQNDLFSIILQYSYYFDEKKLLQKFFILIKYLGVKFAITLSVKYLISKYFSHPPLKFS